MPRFVYRAVEYLLKCGLATEGLFRVAASVAQVRQLCAAYNNGEDPDLEVGDAARTCRARPSDS